MGEVQIADLRHESGPTSEELQSRPFWLRVRDVVLTVRIVRPGNGFPNLYISSGFVRFIFP